MMFRGSVVREKLKQRGDLLFLGVMMLLFVLGAAFALWQSNAVRDAGATDLDQTSVELQAFVRSGLQVVPINEPLFVPVGVALASFDAREPVIALIIGETQRAYPLSILIRHEVVNDQVAEQYIAVTYCPLCNSAIVFDRRLEDGYVLQLGITGNVYKSNFVMYDDVTHSWWHQISGEALVGPMVGTHLEMLPSLVVGFGTFAERYPDGEVLIGDASQPNQDYGLNPYVGYDGSSNPLLSTDDFDERLPPMERVLAVVIDDQPLAYSFEYLERVGAVNTEVDAETIVAFWQPGAVSVLDHRSIVQSEDVGQAAVFHRVWDGQALTFRSEANRFFDNETNSEWNIFGEAISGPLQGATLRQYDCFQHFWFAWSSTYPETLIYNG